MRLGVLCLVSVFRSHRPYRSNPLMTSSRQMKVDETTREGCISDSCYTRICYRQTDKGNSLIANWLGHVRRNAMKSAMACASI